jgi:hypothetical protein
LGLWPYLEQARAIQPVGSAGRRRLGRHRRSGEPPRPRPPFGAPRQHWWGDESQWWLDEPGEHRLLDEPTKYGFLDESAHYLDEPVRQRRLDEPVGHRPLDGPARRRWLEAGIRRRWLEAGIRRRWLEAGTRHPWFTALGAGAGFMVLASVTFILPKQPPSAMMTDCRAVPCTAPGGRLASPQATHGLSGAAKPPADSSPVPAASTLPAAVPSATTSVAPQLPPTVTVTYAIIARWYGGMLGEFTMTNNGSANITGWELSAAFPGDQIRATWGAAGPAHGGDTLVMEAQPDWPTIAPGSSQSGYFIARGDTTYPSNCTFNGAACAS